MNFLNFRAAFDRHFATFSKGDLFVLDVERDDLWATYLGAFTNDPIFKTRSEHNCSTCRAFVKNIGGLVSIRDGVVTSVWDFDVPDEPEYQKVVDAMAALKLRHRIRDVFLTPMASFGVEKTRAMIEGTVHTFNHFFTKVPAKAVVAKKEVDTQLGNLRSSRDLLVRALNEITTSAVDETLELISSNSIYRGEEFKAAVESLSRIKRQQKALGVSPDIFAWENLRHPVARIKNTAIGTLLEDLSGGLEIEDAVKRFEKVVAPTNYKRPTSLVTPKMIESARAKVTELGLIGSMDRRYATLADITVNNVIFADRSARRSMKDKEDVFSNLKQDVASASRKHFDRVDTVTIEKFIEDVLPTAETLEVFFENKHMGHLVSIVTEAHAGSTRMFKWDNPFSWSYNGDVADSIKERVKAAGGNVTGDVCCRLAWSNYDDLDFHMVEVANRYQIYYGNRFATSPSGGKLDVDANAGAGHTRTPVENIFYANHRTMKDGDYVLEVNQFSRRETKDNTFTVEIDVMGDIFTFEGKNPVTDNTKLQVARLVKKGSDIQVHPIMESTASTRTEWNISTNNFHRVNLVMLSPNHWDGERGVGNKHFFFLLDQCVNAGNARGFYNEYLRPELDANRKVLELIGGRQRTEETENQLSGLGFSSTKKDELVVRVTGKVSRVLKITF